MRKTMDSASARIGIIVILVLLVTSAGCIRTVQNAMSGEGAPAEPQSASAAGIVAPPPGDLVPGTGVTETVSPDPKTPGLEVNVVSPDPYITPDPYRLPYRDFTNRSESDLWQPYTLKRYPQFSKMFILRSNSTAIRVNVTQGPLEICLDFSPQFTDPDHSNMANVDEGGEGEEATGVQMSSFVFSNAEVTVIDAASNGTVAQDGYNGVYSTDTAKEITVYRDGPYVITLTGNFIDVGVKIFTGTAQYETPTPAPVPEYDNWEDE